MEGRRRRSVRLPAHDYTSPGAYFLTICTAHRVCLFGSVRNQDVVLSKLGVLADVLWRQAPSHVEGIDLDAFVVMPNHLHAIVVIPGDGRGTAHLPWRAVPGCRAPTEARPETFSHPRKGSLATLVRSYKSAVTKEAGRILGIREVWQRGYYEHVVRGRIQLLRVRDYIENNPTRWSTDDYFRPGGLP